MSIVSYCSSCCSLQAFSRVATCCQATPFAYTMRTVFLRPSPTLLSTTVYGNAPCSSACNSAIAPGGKGAGGSGAGGGGGGWGGGGAGAWRRDCCGACGAGAAPGRPCGT